MSDVAPAAAEAAPSPTAEAPAAAPTSPEAAVVAAAEAPAAPADPSAEAAEPDAPADLPEGEAPEADPFDDESKDTFDRKYVEKLRQEAAEKRTALKSFEESFAPYNEDERGILLGMVQGLASDDPDLQKATGEQLLTIAKEILGEDALTQVEDPDRPLTQADLDKREAAQKAKAEEEAAIQAVIKEANDLGFKEGTADYAALMFRAHAEHAGDLKAAAEAQQKALDDKVLEYLEDIKSGAKNWPKRPQADGGAVPKEQAGPRSFASARASAKARAVAAGLG